MIENDQGLFLGLLAISGHLRSAFEGNGLFGKKSGFGQRPYGTFSDGNVWESLTLPECWEKCPIQAEGTAYIGDGPHGLTV